MRPAAGPARRRARLRDLARWGGALSPKRRPSCRTHGSQRMRLGGHGGHRARRVLRLRNDCPDAIFF
eukprot:1409214-Prymnesium_polylepis.1